MGIRAGQPHNSWGERGNQLGLCTQFLPSRFLFIKAETEKAEKFLWQLRRDSLVSRLWYRTRTWLSTTSTCHGLYMRSSVRHIHLRFFCLKDLCPTKLITQGTWAGNWKGDEWFFPFVLDIFPNLGWAALKAAHTLQLTREESQPNYSHWVLVHSYIF